MKSSPHPAPIFWGGGNPIKSLTLKFRVTPYFFLGVTPYFCLWVTPYLLLRVTPKGSPKKKVWGHSPSKAWDDIRQYQTIYDNIR